MTAVDSNNSAAIYIRSPYNTYLVGGEYVVAGSEAWQVKCYVPGTRAHRKKRHPRNKSYEKPKQKLDE